MRRIVLLLAAAIIFIIACKHQPTVPDTGGFPDAVGKILVQRCATAGCHNAASYTGAYNLRLDSWDKLFEGGTGGAVVIPYSPENSSLLQFINVHSDLGLIKTPTMPLNAEPLSRDEYITIRDWIINGAPDKNGNIPFGSNPDTRQKIYITMQGCDLLGVIDAASNLVMRYIQVGKADAIESPHCVRVSPDGKYAYVSFIAGNYIQKIDTRTDKVVGEINMGAAPINDTTAQWNVLNLSADGKHFIVSKWADQGAMYIINTETMTWERSYKGDYVWPHASATSAGFDTFFVTANYSNVVYKISPVGGINKKVVITSGGPRFGNGVSDPHEILMTPDYSRYFLTCEATTANEVRVMDSRADTLMKVFPVGIKPQEIAVSKKKPYMLVTCMEDNNSYPGSYRGSVYVFNYLTLQLVKRIDGPFFQPHGITVDDQNDKFYIASTNADPNGPAPHHASACGGRNGWYSVYDLNTLEPSTTRRYETSVEPYSADTRFK